MSYCLNPNCPNPNDPANAGRSVCAQCGSEILLKGRYRVTKTLGGGGFGKTYEITDKQDSEHKVLKVLLKSHPKAIELFKQEAEVLIGLKDPGIPRVDPDGYFTFYPKDSDEPLHCLVMEFIEGANLQDWMKNRRHKAISEEQAVDWLKQLSEILGKVHQQNYFHRDIKPQNIMCKPNGQLVLIDFGTAREVSDTYMVKVEGGQNVTGIVSPGYTAPEQTSGKAVPQSDFFSLGRTFVYLLTGKPPTAFPENPRSGKLQWHKSASHISTDVANVIDYLMAPFPGNRPQSTQTIVKCLEEIENPPSSDSSFTAKKDRKSGNTKENDTSGKLKSKGKTLPPREGNRFSSFNFNLLSQLNLKNKLGPVATILVLGLLLSQFLGIWRFGMFPANPIVVVNGLLSNRLLEKKLSSKEGRIYAIAQSPDGEFLASSGLVSISIWNLKTGKLVRVLQEAHTAAIVSLTISPNGEILVSGSVDNSIRLWNLERGIRMLTIPEGHKGTITALAISPDGRTLVSGSDDRLMRLWNIPTGNRVLTIPQESGVNALTFTRDGRTLVSGNEDGSVKLWNPKTGVNISTLQEDTAPIDAIAISPNGDLLASGDDKGIIRLWNLETNTQEKILKGHSEPVNALAFTPDGQTLVSGARKIAVWELDETKPQATTILGHAGEVSSIAISPDGKQFITGSRDWTIKIWRMP
ncbi:MAG: protein kinase [Okeania sp. SIO2H7]|nr:protein kinase [Okeania sp. SIO2H7]